MMQHWWTNCGPSGGGLHRDGLVTPSFPLGCPGGERSRTPAWAMGLRTHVVHTLAAYEPRKRALQQCAVGMGAGLC